MYGTVRYEFLYFLSSDIYKKFTRICLDMHTYVRKYVYVYVRGSLFHEHDWIHFIILFVDNMSLS